MNTIRKCEVCGEDFESDSRLQKRFCDSECSFWWVKIGVKDTPYVVRAKGFHYIIAEENEFTTFKGCGGARFNINFKDGRKVTTTNLWCQGPIPEFLKDVLPDNAEFVNGTG